MCVEIAITARTSFIRYTKSLPGKECLSERQPFQLRRQHETTLQRFADACDVSVGETVRLVISLSLWALKSQKAMAHKCGLR